MTQKLSTLFCILTVAATAANSLQKHPIICFTQLTYWKLQAGNIVDLSLTWQEAEEGHEDHRQEAKGGDPGKGLLAPHRAHLVWPNFIIYVFVYNTYIHWCKQNSTMFSIVGNRKNTSETPS